MPHMVFCGNSGYKGKVLHYGGVPLEAGIFGAVECGVLQEEMQDRRAMDIIAPLEIIVRKDKVIK